MKKVRILTNNNTHCKTAMANVYISVDEKVCTRTPDTVELSTWYEFECNDDEAIGSTIKFLHGSNEELIFCGIDVYGIPIN